MTVERTPLARKESFHDEFQGAHGGRAFQCKEVDRVPVFSEQGASTGAPLGITYHEMVTDGEKNAMTDLACTT